MFFSADQRTFVTLNDTPKRSPYVFFSVFEDGAYLETNALASPTLASSTEDLLQLNALPNAPAAALWRAHVEAISERQILRGTEALAWAPEQYREVAAYVHRLLTWQQHGSDPTCRPDFSVATAGRECFVI